MEIDLHSTAVRFPLSVRCCQKSGNGFLKVSTALPNPNLPACAAGLKPATALLCKARSGQAHISKSTTILIRASATPPSRLPHAIWYGHRATKRFADYTPTALRFLHAYSAVLVLLALSEPCYIFLLPNLRPSTPEVHRGYLRLGLRF